MRMTFRLTRCSGLRRAAEILIIALMSMTANGEEVELWGRWSVSLEAGSDAARDTEVTVELTAPSGEKHNAQAFWDGGRSWGVRFMPVEEGGWKWRSASKPAVKGLDGVSGRFTCRRRKSDNPFLVRGPLRVSKNGRNLEHADGTPFFWLGDTAWNGALLSTDLDWAEYLSGRAAKRFSVIQFVAVAPWRTAPENLEGERAFSGREKIEVNPLFFRRLDARIDAINASGMLAAPVMLWAIKGDENPGWYLPEDQAIRVCRYLRARYDANHVVWIPAGDGNYSGEFAERWKRICRAVFADSPHPPVVMHPGGMMWPHDAFNGEKWLDLIGYQSGHGDDDRTLKWMQTGQPAHKWREEPARPFINLEPPYEDHISYQSKQRHSAFSVRRAAYWSLLNAPPAGLTYGAHGVWSWQTVAGIPRAHQGAGEAKPWREAAALPGSSIMKVLVEFFGSLPWWRLRPCPEMLADQPGRDDPRRFIAAARDEEGEFAVVYLPVGGGVEIKPDAAKAFAGAEWVDPRAGARSAAVAATNRFTAPDDRDWVLVLKSGVKGR